MNSKRAKVLRKMSENELLAEHTSEYLSTLHKFIGVSITRRHVYKYIKSVDKTLNTPQKELFNVNKIRATL
jgi:hypothetical protein